MLLKDKMNFSSTLKFYLYHYQQLKKDFSLPAHQKSKQNTNQEKIPAQILKKSWQNNSFSAASLG